MNNNRRSRVQVITRCRPQNDIERAKTKDLAVKFENDKLIEVMSEETSDYHKFTFDEVFKPDSTQEEVFNRIGIPLLSSVFEGFNTTAFCYGQTSSGKTHTMLGPDIKDDKQAGLIPRVVDRLFTMIGEADENIEFQIKASFVEIYLERVRDLLDTTKQNLLIRESKKRGIFVENMTERYVSSFREIMDLLYAGQMNRRTSATAMNEGSSRSHSIFMITLIQKDEKTGVVKNSKINLVDLAGSEKVKKTAATGARLEEAKMINLSLSALGNVIKALTEHHGKNTHIPYRDSKLTRMLQESLGGNAKTYLIINVSPSLYNANETLSTLRFGNRAKSIKNNAVVNAIRSVEELQQLLMVAEHTIETQHSKIRNLTNVIEKNGFKLGADDNTLVETNIKKDANQIQVSENSDLLKKNLELDTELSKLKELHESYMVDFNEQINTLTLRHEQDQEELERSNKEIDILQNDLQIISKDLDNEKSNVISKETELLDKQKIINDIKTDQEKLSNMKVDYDRTKLELSESKLTLKRLTEEVHDLSKEIETNEKKDAKNKAELIALNETLINKNETISKMKNQLKDTQTIVSRQENDLKDKELEGSQNLNENIQKMNQLIKDNENNKDKIKQLETEIKDLQVISKDKDAKIVHARALEQRLGQLVTVHKKLFRKYTTLDLTYADSRKMLILRDDRIKTLEEQIKIKDFNFRAEQERHLIRKEELKLDHQRDRHALEKELEHCRSIIKSLAEYNIEPTANFTSTDNNNNNNNNNTTTTTEEFFDTIYTTEVHNISNESVESHSKSNTSRAPRISKPIKGGKHLNATTAGSKRGL